MATNKIPLQLQNGDTATFDCTWGRGCEGHCCKNGRPGLREHEQTRIEENLEKFLSHLRPAARAIVKRDGVVTRRFRNGLPMAAVESGWCVFFNEGCVLHKVGLQEGDALKYKPLQCAIFPLLWDDDGRWYVRQKGYKDETWNDLPCLNPAASSVKAVDTLKAELALAATLEV